MIEEMLRETFREQVTAPPAVEAMADRVVAKARRARRRRRVLATGAAAVCVGLAAFWSAVLGPGLGPPPATPMSTALSPTWLPTEPITSLPVDVVVGRYVFLAGGGVLSLADVVPCEDGRCVRGVWRVGDGYLVSVHQPDAPVGAAVLWHVPDTGAASVVVDGDGALIVARGTTLRPGIQVVWSDDGRLHAGTYEDHRVVDVVSTPAPEIEVERTATLILRPQAVVGDAVALTGSSNSGSARLWDVWFPDRGDYEPAEYPSTGFYGITTDGERIIGWHASLNDQRIRCLSEVKPEEFEPVRSVCPSPFTVDARIHPSPDGRWWLVVDTFPVAGTNRREPGLALFDAEQVWHGEDPIHRWPMPRLDVDGVWLDTQTFVTVDRSSATVSTLFTDGRSGATVTLPTPGPGVNITVVPDLG